MFFRIWMKHIFQIQIKSNDAGSLEIKCKHMVNIILHNRNIILK